MFKLYIILLLISLLIGCEPPQKEKQPDQNLRREIFLECLKNIPKGPTNVKYNDWSEVVDSCGTQAYYMSLK